MKNRIECAYCEGYANLQKESRTLTYRKEDFKIIAHFYKCEKCGEEFTTNAVDHISLVQAHNQYRERHNIPFAEEIAAIRRKYSLTAAKMSEVLGLGPNGYTNYEKGEVPTPAISNLITTASKPEVFLDLLEKRKGSFTTSQFGKVRDIAFRLVTQERERALVAKFLNIYNESNTYTGYTKLQIEKVENLLLYFINTCSSQYNDKLKINKLFFFTDFYHYKNHGKSITGLSYRAIQYGPVPSYFDNIFNHFENTFIIRPEWIRENNGAAREVFKSNKDSNLADFSQEELDSINQIAGHFKDARTWDIVELSHKEKAWIEFEKEKKLIAYQEFAFELALFVKNDKIVCL